MIKQLRVEQGSPLPLGASLTDSGCNFVVYAPHAEKVELCLFDRVTEALTATVTLPVKTGKVWHGYLEGITEGALYGFRVYGKAEPTLGHSFDDTKLLIDPYAKAINKTLTWNREQYVKNNTAFMPKSVVVGDDLTGNRHKRPNIALNNTILYEAHVKGLTQCHPDIPERLRGTYLGACHPVILEHFKKLGITSVQFLPVAASMSEPFITDKGLSNYWGYNPVNFFAPEPRYASTDATNEFKTMVRTYHEHGLEVILDVVFNHTAEAGIDGPVLSFKGFDNSSFYLFEQDENGGSNYHAYSNNSGCGNSVNTAHHFAMGMVLDALRYWYQVLGVDGFRFDLAASLGRDPHEFSSNSGFFRALRQDPILQDAKLIAEPWDIGMGGYRLGQFPSHWVECNDKYRDNVRAFWRGDKGLTGEFATRLLGSRDVFRKNHRSPHSTVNYIAYHDGFTLQDLVSYNERHNEANREQNRDGHGHNVSANYGVEGETKIRNILLKRERQKRNMIATLFLSQGIPHFLGGDELSRTQQGNNNAYCQDNAISWFDWQLDTRQKEFFAFCSAMIAIRKESRLLGNLNQEDDSFYNQHNVQRVEWFRPDGQTKVADDWHDYDNQAFAVELKGTKDVGEHWLIMFNASDHDVTFKLPELKARQEWRLVLDTRYQTLADIPDIAMSGEFIQAYKSIGIFSKKGDVGDLS